MEDAETHIRSFKRKGKIKITNNVYRLQGPVGREGFRGGVQPLPAP